MTAFIYDHEAIRECLRKVAPSPKVEVEESHVSWIELSAVVPDDDEPVCDYAGGFFG